MDYYLKYIKYKIKYLNLLVKSKRKLEEIGNIDSKSAKKNNMETETNAIIDEETQKKIQNEKVICEEKKFINERNIKLSSLFNLFTTEPIFVLNTNPNPNLNHIPTSTSKSKPQKKPQDNRLISEQYNLRPLNPKVKYVGTWTPELIKNLKSNGIDNDMIDEILNEFEQDDKDVLEQIAKKTKIEDDSDSEYVETGNKGKYIECWIADNMCCPCCGENSLRRYVKDNMPCIDLICINPKHKFHNGVKFFQVKAKKESIESTIYSNFNLGSRQIHTGSKNIGKYIHNIYTNNDFYNLLIGYICIEYKLSVIENVGEKILITNKSFVVLPKIYLEQKKNLFRDEFEDKDNKKIDFEDKIINLDKLNIIVNNITYDDNKKNLYYWYINNDPLDNIIEFSVLNNIIIPFSTKNKIILFNGKKTSFITLDYSPTILNKWIVEQNPFMK